MFELGREMTSFMTRHGLFCYKVIPFGLKNAGATYQNLVKKMFTQLIGHTMEVYVGDMITKSQNSTNFFSKSYQGAKKRYPRIKEIPLVLVVTVQKLRHYFQSHTIIIPANTRLK